MPMIGLNPSSLKLVQVPCTSASILLHRIWVPNLAELMQAKIRFGKLLDS